MKDKKNIEDIYPLTDNQMSFLLNHISSTGTDSGQVQVTCRMQGVLDSSVFTRAWAALVEKHGSMRSSIHWNKLRKPLQVVHKRIKPDIRFTREPQANNLQLALDQLPNHVVTVYSHSQTDHIVIWTCHHIFVDGWSMSIALNDFISFYNRILNGKNVRSADTRAPQFKLYLDWLKTCDMDRAKSHWLSSSGKRMIRDGQEQQQNTGDSVYIEQAELSPRQLEMIRRLSDHHGATFSELLQCAWSIFLALISGSNNASFVLTMSGRSAPVAGIESIVGQLSTALPVEMQVSMQQKLADVISKVKNEVQHLRNYEFLSLVQLARWGWQASHIPEIRINDKPYRMNTLVVVENFSNPHQPEHFDSGLDMVSYESDAVSNYPLTLVVMTAHDKLSLKLLSNHVALTPPLTRHLLDAFESLFGHLLENSEDDISGCRHLVEHIFTDETVLPAAGAKLPVFPPDRRRSYKPPETEEQDHLQKIWQDIFATKRKIGIDEDYFELGGTSLNIVLMYSRIESRFDCKLPLSSILEASTIEKMAAIITHQPQALNNIMVPVQPEGHRLPVFGIHAQDILFYRDISNALGNAQPFYAIQQLESDQIDDFSYTSIQEMAADYISEIKKVQRSGPYTIIGLCMGCTIGYEMAYQLTRSGDCINALIMLDPDIPELVFNQKAFRASSLLSGFNSSSINKLINLPLVYQFALLKGRLRIARKSLSGPLEKRRAIRRHKNWQLNQKFKPRAYRGKIRVIQSGEYYRSMNRYYENSVDDVSPGGQVHIEIVEGSHTSIFSPPKVFKIAELINQSIL